MDLRELEDVLRARQQQAPSGSYSATLLADPERVARKIVEEAFELGLELTRPEPDPERVASEAADVVFHTLAGLVGAGVPLAAVLDELAARRGATPRAQDGVSPDGPTEDPDPDPDVRN